MNANAPTPRRVFALPSMPQFKPLPLGLLLASLLTLGALGLFATRSQAADATKATPVAKPSLTVSLTRPQAGMVPVTLSANGSVAAWQEASVGAEAPGLRVLELKAQVGDSVKRGQVLATFAAESVQADVALARAGLSEATANAAEATANAERARVVQNTGALSAQQISQYLTAELTARARVESAKAQLDAQLLRLKNTQLLAPDSGIITQRSGTVGAVVGAGTELFRLIRQGRLEWRGEVTSAELGRITTGTSVLLTAPSGAQAKGRVRMVSPTVDAGTRNGLVYVDLTGLATQTGQFPAGPPQGKLAPSGGSEPHTVGSVGAMFKPGMFARGEFALGTSGALTLPQSAVVVRDGFSYVYRVGADNRVSALKVQSGRVLGERVEVVSGVTPEDRVVTSGGGFLSDGDLVRVADEKSVPNSAAAPAKPAQAASK
ncbi:MAG: efflux RND transporter periplasmic adaptor subunit [Burkholderiales bacterium]|nr:efflux RND transporter periplasmic adaptor subunit [Burkholderiales bacterium]